MVWRPETVGELRNFTSNINPLVAQPAETTVKNTEYRIGDEIALVVPINIARSMRRVARSLRLPNFMYLEEPGQKYTPHKSDEELPVPKGHRRVRLGLYRVTDLSGFEGKMNKVYERMGMEPIILPK